MCFIVQRQSDSVTVNIPEGMTIDEKGKVSLASANPPVYENLDQSPKKGSPHELPTYEDIENKYWDDLPCYEDYKTTPINSSCLEEVSHFLINFSAFILFVAASCKCF